MLIQFIASIMENRGGVFQIALDVRFNRFLSIPWNNSDKSGEHFLTLKSCITACIGIYSCIAKCLSR